MKPNVESVPNENIRKLQELMKDLKFAMLTTVDLDGSLHSRPMATQQIEFDGDLWFFSGRSSGKVKSIEKDQHVNVCFASPEHNRYISISGRAETISDRAKMEELWNPLYKTWFPEGLEDPDLVLIKFSAESAEYWDSPSNMIVRLAGFGKSLLEGQRRPGPGEHQKVPLPH